MVYELKLDQYQGPLEKLLELIESKKLEITEISLATVTDDFLRYLQTLTDIKQTQTNTEGKIGVLQSEVREGLRILADFIAVASRLILIKSKSLLPEISLTDEEETEIKDLELRLRLYAEFKPAMRFIDGLWQKHKPEFSRPYFLNTLSSAQTMGMPFFYPGSNCSAESLIASLEKNIESFKVWISEEKATTEEIISVEETIKEIVSRLQKIGELSFELLSSKRPRPEIVAAFLAILHLAHEQVIMLEQKSHFSDILIKPNDANLQM